MTKKGKIVFVETFRICSKDRQYSTNHVTVLDFTMSEKLLPAFKKVAGRYGSEFVLTKDDKELEIQKVINNHQSFFFL